MNTVLIQLENYLSQPNLITDMSRVYGRVALSAFIFYLLLIIIFNTIGKRSMSNLSMYDYVTTLAVGSIVSSTIVLKNVTLIDGLIGVIVLLSFQFVITLSSAYFPKFFHLLNPSPTVLFLKGEWIEKNMIKYRITEDEIYAAIRIQGQCTSDQIFAVLLESNSSLSVITSASPEKEDEITRFL